MTVLNRGGLRIFAQYDILCIRQRNTTLTIEFRFNKTRKK